MNEFDNVQHGEQGRQRHGSPYFYQLLQEAAETHDKKSADYASNDKPYGNYEFAGQLSRLFTDPSDGGFIGRIAEKLYRLANLENGGKIPKNEAVEDTEVDIFTITGLWMAFRRERRFNKRVNKLDRILNQDEASDRMSLADEKDRAQQSEFQEFKHYIARLNLGDLNSFYSAMTMEMQNRTINSHKSEAQNRPKQG